MTSNQETVISQISTPVENVASFPGGSTQPSNQIPTPMFSVPTPTPFTSPVTSIPIFPPNFPGPMDPLFSQAFQNFGQFMSMFQQPGGFSPFIPGLYPKSLPQTSVIRPVVPTNLIREMDKTGPSRSRRIRSRRSRTQITLDGDVRSVHSRDEDWDLPQAQKKLKGKAIQPEGSRRSAFQRLGHEGRNQNRPAKERLGVETTPLSAFNRLAGQREHEDLTKFLTRWKDEIDKVEEKDDKTAMSLLASGLRSGELYKEFCRRPPQSYQEAYNTAWDYADAEAQVSFKREAEQGHPKGKISLKKEIELPGRAKAEVMEVIYGGPEGGDSASQRKKWGRVLYVGTVALNPRSKQARREPITFTDRDLPATGEDHNDPLVITMDMGGVDVSRVLVDTGSSVNVLYLDAFEKLKLCRTRLEPLKTPLSRFTGDSIEAEGSILLTCELGTGEQVILKQMRFVVVNIKCVHNAILGRPGINKVRGVISMAHLCMKFYTPGGIGQVRGDQKKARHCYLEAVKKMTKAFERVTLVSQEEDRSKLEPGDETEQIVLREAFPERMVRIGRDLPGGLRDEIISVLREYADSFAWSVADMPGISRSVICHRLAVMEGSRPVKQKKRHLANLAKIESLDQPSTDRFEIAAIQPGQNSATGIIGADDDWRYDLMEYLETGQKPDDEERARKVVLRAPRFQVIDGHLYKRAIGGPLLRCLTNPEAERVIAEVHEGVCAAHQMSRTLAQMIILFGYYWSTNVGDCERPVEERRTLAAVKLAGYQQSVKRYHDNRVGPRYFQVHDEVLRRRDASKPNERGKLVRNWEGPYRIKAIIRPGTYQLETMEGGRVDRHWNSHHLRKFFR
ncbi:unnamed protein product [Cuscuta campestris]|uniref:Integrase zinc-binding domain-containing protein n=1 Tax=Cuscuta campestris TaxID=132261 RepID=A0A484N3R8_9ASTE|nr:unnamed protein product [Cuscuta campestris]